MSPFRNWTDADIAAHNAKVSRDNKPGEYLKAQQTPAQKKSLVIVLPFKLPTWNALLAMNRWQRAKERHRIHDAVLRSIQSASGLPIPMVSAQKLQLTDLSTLESLEMILANTCQKSGSRRSKGRMKRP
jgi:hypothetical protein